MNTKPTACLVLSDGTIFYGMGFGKIGTTSAELCFNTSMTGYQEIMTDPSYDSQIITFTNPHIGNTGVNLEDVESLKIHASGIIIRDNGVSSSSWRTTDTLTNYLKNYNIIIIYDNFKI